ncbi:hypothetical protein [Aureimonas sp. N4]|uniref:hypothetical protein n=1 Tax=Aureimonas sp. N4 TaxID=1638165 RepID=UPI0007830612|nr:hypothetical protein [Aureimonas sp. N4]
MSEEHSRTPLSVRGSALALFKGRAVETMALGPMNAFEDGEGAALHPDFLARAAVWRDHKAGLISLGEARRRSELIGADPQPRRLATSATARIQHPRAKPTTAPRHARSAPRESRQYSGAMATTAARDDRLTPHAKAFLQVLRARCGKSRQTAITKGTMGAVMARSARTIRRYLADLVRFGYIQLAVRRNARGLHLGLTVTLTDLVMPFYEDAKGLARWLAETPSAAALPFKAVLSPAQTGVTVLSSNNQSQMNLSLILGQGSKPKSLLAKEGLGREARKAILLAR